MGGRSPGFWACYIKRGRGSLPFHATTNYTRAGRHSSRAQPSPELSYRRRRSATHEESRRRASQSEATRQGFRLQVRRFFLAEREREEEGSPGVSSRNAGMRPGVGWRIGANLDGFPGKKDNFDARRRRDGRAVREPPKDLGSVERERVGAGRRGSPGATGQTEARQVLRGAAGFGAQKKESPGSLSERGVSCRLPSGPGARHSQVGGSIPPLHDRRPLLSGFRAKSSPEEVAALTWPGGEGATRQRGC